MRRTDKEINSREAIDKIIRSCEVLRLGLAKGNEPYIVPVSFGYDGSSFYFHTALVGRKIDFFQANPSVCFELEHGVSLLSSESDACNWSFSYQCIVGNGKLEELLGYEEKHRGLLHVMRQYSEKDWTFTPESLEKIRVWKVAVESVSGKQSKDKFLAGG